VLPLDGFVDAPVLRMEVSGDPQAVPRVQQEVQAAVDDATAGSGAAMQPLERFSFLRRLAADVCGHRDGREAPLGLLHLQEGRRPTGGVTAWESLPYPFGHDLVQPPGDQARLITSAVAAQAVRLRRRTRSQEPVHNAPPLLKRPPRRPFAFSGRRGVS